MQLHRHVLYHAQPGDIVVVDARGDLTSGVFGEMMLTYFMGRGGAGVVSTAACATSPRRGTRPGAVAARGDAELPRPDRLSIRSRSTCRSRAAVCW